MPLPVHRPQPPLCPCPCTARVQTEARRAQLDIDTATRTASTFGVVASGGPRKWIGGALGHNSMIYAIPFDAGDVLEINPYTKALTRFGHLGLQACKWYGGVRAPNGRICARRIPNLALSRSRPEPRLSGAPPRDAQTASRTRLPS